MIDEIYLAKRVEASRGQLFGLTDNRQVATTSLCFMIKSLLSSYQDMIDIHSVKSLKAETQKKCFDKIMLLLHEVGFNVMGICVDNAAANRKFYKEFLCGGCWQSSIKNSFSGERIFLLFDPNHIVKNIYNNFLTKKVFKMLMLSPILSQNLTAKFLIELIFMFMRLNALFINKCSASLTLDYLFDLTVFYCLKKRLTILTYKAAQ